MSNNTRPDIELVLSVRSYERVFVLAAENGVYNEGWEVSETLPGAGLIDQHAVVIIDRAVSKNELTEIGKCGPRLVALMPLDAAHEKKLRSDVTDLYPFVEFWAILTSMGKALITKDICGYAYDRDAVIDMRDAATA